jgi:leucyl aminopeptidase (aminopeptidase T)
VHEDFMIGGPGVNVSATTRDGREVPVLIEGQWEIP